MVKSSDKKLLQAREYREGLEKAARERYDAKLELLGGEDPYAIRNDCWSDSEDLLPATTYADILTYLLYSPSPYTLDDMRSYKGLEAYNQFVCGFVRDVTSKAVEGKSLVKAKVLHSQRLSEKPLQPWVVADAAGRILAGHCTCMAGLGETCTHVAALLFWIEEKVKLRDSKTVTEAKSYWLLPASVKGASYKQLRDIDFSSARSLKRKLDQQIAGTSRSTSLKQKASVPIPTANEMSQFFSRLHISGKKSGTKPVILSLVKEYADDYVPKAVQKDYPAVLTELRDEDAIHLSFDKLLSVCKKVELQVTREQAELVESETRGQSDCKLWFRFRAGRITASKMKSVCHTNPASPALSLIRSICYPENYTFSTKATKWGCCHEQDARNIFVEKLKEEHDNVQEIATGFRISSEHPFLGASPDGMVDCDCCGSSLVEIKCPFCHKSSKLEDASANDKTFCLVKNPDGKLTLDKKHAYYYQIQTQLGVWKMDGAFFVVWTNKDLHVERIPFDSTMWSNICQKSKHVFDTAILPELVGKFYSKLPMSETKVLKDIGNIEASSSESAVEKRWCSCDQVEFGEMIGCDNEQCSIQWFHYACVGVASAPRGKWYCPDCRKMPQFRCKRMKIEH